MTAGANRRIDLADGLSGWFLSSVEIANSQPQRLPITGELTIFPVRFKRPPPIEIRRLFVPDEPRRFRRNPCRCQIGLRVTLSHQRKKIRALSQPLRLVEKMLVGVGDLQPFEFPE